MTNYLVTLIVLKCLWFLILSMNTNTLPNYTRFVGQMVIKLVVLMLKFHLLQPRADQLVCASLELCNTE